MSAHVLRFLLSYWAVLSQLAGTRYSLVDPSLIGRSLVDCLEHHPVDDDALDALEPGDRAAWLCSTFGKLLARMAPEAVKYAGCPRPWDPNLAEQALVEVRIRLPRLQGDLSIEALNESIGKQPRTEEATTRRPPARRRRRSRRRPLRE